jgi:hypothetical protein
VHTPEFPGLPNWFAAVCRSYAGGAEGTQAAVTPGGGSPAADTGGEVPCGGQQAVEEPTSRRRTPGGGEVTCGKDRGRVGRCR